MNSNKNRIYTLIVSDFYLGSRVSRSRAVKKLLNDFNFLKLILLG